MTSNHIKNIAIIILILLLGWFIYKHFSTPKNVVITDISNLPKQKTDSLVVNDSTKGAIQSSVITSQLETILAVQNQKQAALNELARLKAQYVLQYTETLTQGEVIGVLQDSLSRSINALLEAKSSGSITIEVYEKLKDSILKERHNYTIPDKWTYEKGSFTLGGDVRRDSLRIVSKPFVTFGETGGFLKRPEIKVVVGNENPLIKQDSLKSYVYKPPRKVELSLTGIGLSDGKSATIGAGINIKKGPISLTLGYTLLHKQF